MTTEIKPARCRVSNERPGTVSLTIYDEADDLICQITLPAIEMLNLAQRIMTAVFSAGKETKS